MIAIVVLIGVLDWPAERGWGNVQGPGNCLGPAQVIKYCYSPNNHASDRYVKTGNKDYVSVLYAGITTHLLTEYILNKSNIKHGIT